MIADQQLAADVAERVLEVNRLLNEAAALVQSRGTIEEAAAFALSSPWPSFDELVTDIYA